MEVKETQTIYFCGLHRMFEKNLTQIKPPLFLTKSQF